MNVERQRHNQQITVEPGEGGTFCIPLLSPASRPGDYETHSVRVLFSVCHAVIKGCTSHWLFLLGLFNVFYDLIAYVLSFDAVISHLGP